MGDVSYGNAMTEIALALAMAFFAIMVLTMVSMGAPATKAPAAAAGTPVKLPLAPPSPQSQTSDKATAGKPEIIVFWNGRFYDQDLKPADVAAGRFAGRVILALSPQLSMAAALAARGRLRATDIVVSTLDARWLETIGQAIGDGPKTKE